MREIWMRWTLVRVVTCVWWMLVFIAVRNGYSCVPVALADGLDIKLNAAVKKVEYNQRGVEVTVYNPRNPTATNTYHGKQFLLLASILKFIKFIIITFSVFNRLIRDSRPWFDNQLVALRNVAVKALQNAF